METITNLIKDTPIPKMVKVRQNFDKTCIPESDIPGIITRELDRPEIGGKIQPGQKIAITCGSRGINHNAVMARAIVDFVKSKGAEPYIVAAMGSHGGATAEGQLQILKDYGVTEEAMGCPVKAPWRRCRSAFPAYVISRYMWIRMPLRLTASSSTTASSPTPPSAAPMKAA